MKLRFRTIDWFWCSFALGLLMMYVGMLHANVHLQAKVRGLNTDVSNQRIQLMYKDFSVKLLKLKSRRLELELKAAKLETRLSEMEAGQ